MDVNDEHTYILDNDERPKTLARLKMPPALLGIFTPLKDHELNITRYAVVGLKNQAPDAAFVVQRVSQEIKDDLMLVSSGIPMLLKCADRIRSKEKDIYKSQMLKQVIRTLSTLILSTVKTDSENPIECDGLPYRMKQKLMKDVGLLEILTDILFFTFKYGEYNLGDLSNFPPDMVKVRSCPQSSPFLMCLRAFRSSSCPTG